MTKQLVKREKEKEKKGKKNYLRPKKISIHMLGVVLDPMNFNVGMRFEYVYPKENLPQIRNTKKGPICQSQDQP